MRPHNHISQAQTREEAKKFMLGENKDLIVACGECRDQITHTLQKLGGEKTWIEDLIHSMNMRATIYNMSVEEIERKKPNDFFATQYSWERLATLKVLNDENLVAQHLKKK